MDSNILSVIVEIAILIVLLIGGIELILRRKGIKPKTITKEKSKIIPEGKLYKAHPILGFVFQSGNFQININDRFEFTANHDERGHRITSENGQKEYISERPEIWIFGCSYTYGWLVNDHETFPWLIQERLKDWEIVNFGVSGYSILQAYLQFKEALSKENAPEIVILAYGSEIHDNRNTLTRHRKKSFSRLERTSPYMVPCGRIIDDELEIIYDSTKYNGYPFSSHSALMKRLEYRYDTRYDNRLKSKDVSKKILLQFKQLCDEVQSTFVVAGIHEGKDTQKMLDFCKQQGMKTINISVDRGAKHPENSHYPHDDHPSPLAHKKYADKIMKHLRQEKLINIKSV